eukprot:scaffold489_cov259-Pinguiococcus_pyrenoidosus.AAC.35
MLTGEDRSLVAEVKRSPAPVQNLPSRALTFLPSGLHQILHKAEDAAEDHEARLQLIRKCKAAYP